jgi:esterase/lipase superfamily enzyme
VLERIAGETYLSGFQSKPLKVSEHSDFSSVSINLLAMYALRENGDVYIWHGDMAYNSKSIYFPEKIDGLKFKSLGVNRSNVIMCAISNNDEIYSNYNHYWRNIPYASTPVPVRIINP